jgi:hypothetical protein
MTVRRWSWLGMLVIAALAMCAYGQVVSAFDTPSWLRVGLFAVAGMAGTLSVFLFPQFKGRLSCVLAIWIPAIVLRVLLLPTAVSDDVSRYLFEGALIRADVSPYAQTADAPELESYRDVHWQAMNHKDQPTAYPPLAELAFAAIGAVSYQPAVYKIVFILADLLTLGAVLQLLRRRGTSLAYSGLYALNPIVLIAYAGEAHFDSLMVAALVWAVCAAEVGRTKLAVTLVSVATGIKCITLPLIPFFAGNRLVVGGLISVGVLLLPALYFYDSLGTMLNALFAFGNTRSFNGLLYDCLLLGGGFPRAVCSGTVVVLFAAVILWRWLWRERAPLDSHMRWILGALIVLSPTVHFWYLAWILPFVCLRPSLPWVTFSLTGGVYFCVWTNSSWGFEWWQQWLFWGPFVLACAYELWSTKGRVVWPFSRGSDTPVALVLPQPSAEQSDQSVAFTFLKQFPREDRFVAGRSAHTEGMTLSRPLQDDVQTVAIVIPTLNAAAELPAALASVERQSVAVSEVVIVDAGSTDETVEVAERSGLAVHVLASARGRGVQIAAGIEAVQADWVVVLHADAVLAATAIESVLSAVLRNPDVVGGALGQRFADGNPELLPIEVLNDLRGVFSRTAFGDQVQFFHRETALRYELMPKQPLMEDVESSWRTRECGGFIFLSQPCLVSHQKWDPKQWLTRFRLVMRIVSKYRWARLRGRRQAEVLSEALYAEYYSVHK